MMNGLKFEVTSNFTCMILLAIFFINEYTPFYQLVLMCLLLFCYQVSTTPPPKKLEKDKQKITLKKSPRLEISVDCPNLLTTTLEPNNCPCNHSLSAGRYVHQNEFLV